MNIDVHQLPIHDAAVREEHEVSHLWFAAEGGGAVLPIGPHAGGFRSVRAAKEAAHDCYPGVEIEFRVLSLSKSDQKRRRGRRR
jgi:hypothetical protein